MQNRWGMKKAFVGLALLLTAGAAASAQTDAGQLQFVTQAVQNTLASSSMHTESQFQSTFDSADTGIQTRGTGSYNVAKAGEGWNAAGTRVTQMTISGFDLTITTEVVVVDGVVYLNFTDLPQVLTQQSGTEIPQGWFEAATLEGQMPALEFDSLSALGDVTLPAAAASILGLTELPGENIDGQAMRVFQMTLDAAALLEGDTAALLSESAGAMMDSMLAGGQLPENASGGPANARGRQRGGNAANVQPPANTPSMSQVTLPENLQVTLTLYIGTSDNLIHRAYTVIATQMDAQGQTIAVTTTRMTDYSAFNQPVQIVAPI
ncbi:MAG: hypothetical protein K8I30_22380 [Anaerolineae bacterium]|nr:hypothetical protein [Anaerolineae bacterium]